LIFVRNTTEDTNYKGYNTTDMRPKGEEQQNLQIPPKLGNT